jgi:hypothetical protein
MVVELVHVIVVLENEVFPDGVVLPSTGTAAKWKMPIHTTDINSIVNSTPIMVQKPRERVQQPQQQHRATEIY